MKFNVLFIIRDHFRTLYDAENKKVSYLDIFVFYGLPIIMSATAYYSDVKLKDEAYGLAIVIFGVFIALLLNIQVAIFSVSHTKWQAPSDTKLMASFEEDKIDKNAILRELNTNLSYMILLCSLVLFVAGYSSLFDNVQEISSIFLIFAFTHFVLNLLMVIKRAHALFQKEYTV